MKRISCSGFARIKHENKLLLILSKSKLEREIKSYSLIGGAYQFDENGYNRWKEMGAQFQSGIDIRMSIPDEKIGEFQEWFEKRTEREVNPERELREEIVGEAEVVPYAKISFEYVETKDWEMNTTRVPFEGQLTRAFYEFFDVEFFDGYTAQMCLSDKEKLDAPIACAIGGFI